MSAHAPADREALAALLRDRSASGTPVGVVGGGSGSRRGWDVAAPHTTLSTRGLDRIVSHEPADLTVTVEGGVPVATLQAALAQRGQTWIQAGHRPDATVGGVLATALSGHRRLRFGAVRDSLLQVVLATGDGRIVSAGGKTVKGVAGYDIPRLAVGSLGTLGVIVEVTLKLWPAPPSAAWFTATGDPTSLAALGARVLRDVHQPGAVLLEPGRLLVEIIGPADDLVAPAGMAPCDAPADPAFPATASVGVPPTAVADLAGRLARLGVRFRAQMGVGTCEVELRDPSDVPAVREAALALGGHAVVTDAPPEFRADPWGPPPPGLAIMRRLRTAFDPAGVLNPGMFIHRPEAAT
ncbi:MAG: FAD-binding protein [Thermoleophilia bacterium]